jgi:hypothetical protein
MVRDLESLIEYLYLRFTNDPILDSKVVVNPTPSDFIVDRICIINKSYSVPDLQLAKLIIDRSEENYWYNREVNPYIVGVPELFSEEIQVLPIKDIFYFSQVPQILSFIKHPCFNYLDEQIKNKDLIELELTEVQDVLKP